MAKFNVGTRSWEIRLVSSQRDGYVTNKVEFKQTRQVKRPRNAESVTTPSGQAFYEPPHDER